ncbi:cell envelope integrity protein TolA [Klebsiella electrica]|uniref:cell envelope integrity protein TolA n=1 Tax=Klebsiella electrica TaxID=1259973 RepID=UPI00142F4460|nr:cell envelope integrity protein TolA [Klebsiella electrica]
MDSVHHIWCPLSSQEYQDLPDGAETTLTDKSAEVDDLLGNPGSPTFPPDHSKIVVYAAQIRNAIVAEMYEPDAYKGKTCSIRIYLQPDGSVNSATAKEGDAKLCKAAISAITRAKIPAAPDNETYQRVKNAALDFRL